MIKMSSGILVVKKINKPTQAKFFKDIHEGDHLEVYHKLRSTSGGPNGLYASDFEVNNYSRAGKPEQRRILISGNNLVNRLSNFELEPLHG